MAKRDYYEVLEVTKSATEEEIKRSYRRLAVQHHPDKHQGDKAAEERFKEISEAFEVLSDPNKKAAYDRYGHEGLKGAFGQGGFQWQDFTHYQDFSDIFEDVLNGFGFGEMFGGGGRRSRSGPRKGANLLAEVSLTLKEAAFGIEKTVSISRAEECSVCKGSGAKEGTKEEVCQECGGRGQVTSVAGFFSVSRACRGCGGTGRIIKSPCASCRGKGTVREKKKVRVKVPAGVDNGTRLRVSAEGEPGEKGGPRGDLFVDIHVQEDSVFHREGNNVYCRVKVPFVTAVFGGEVKAPTLEGETTLKISEGTQSGKVIQLRGKGIHGLRGEGKGDQYCQIVIDVPTDLTHEQKDKLIEFARLCGQDVDKGDKLIKKIKGIFK